jgi:maltooligosyltrehalose trehalohydrolase
MSDRGLPVTDSKHIRRYTQGAEVVPEGGVSFRIWAPGHRKVEIVIESTDRRAPVDEATERRRLQLRPEDSGYFSLQTGLAEGGDLYRVRLDDGEPLYPDPASRFQPDGPHGPSQIVDPTKFSWTDQNWPGLSLPGQVIYEMHIGTFTQQGIWSAAAAELGELARLGITAVEVMPVADFAGRWGWGYDGVNLFAPTRLYGEPDAFRSFVDRAHSLKLGVILDVVYNHLGPDGNYLSQFSKYYVGAGHNTDWGDAINFDGENCVPVRDFFCDNAAYWIDEYHLDGLRLDATHSIYDSSQDHILAAITRRVRRAARGRSTIVIAEDDDQQAKQALPVELGGYGMDALWNDDFHHSAMVALTGRREAYYSHFAGRPQELISAIRHGYLYQGQRYSAQRPARGTPALKLAPWQFVTFLQNHDQISNSACGERCHKLTMPARYRAMAALFLLAPGTPILFQGQEFAASSPFLFFADHSEELAALVRAGRAGFLSQFSSIAEVGLPDPADPRTFLQCKLDFAERERNRETYALHRDLLKLRREDAVFSAAEAGTIDGAVLGSDAFLLRFFGPDADRLVLVNLGIDLLLEPAPEPLLASPEGRTWATQWSSEDPRYGGTGLHPLEPGHPWTLAANSLVVLQSVPSGSTRRQ